MNGSANNGDGSQDIDHKTNTKLLKPLYRLLYTVELQWLEQLWKYENMCETGVVRANEC